MSSTRSLAAENRNRILRIASLTRTSLGAAGRDLNRYGFSRTSSIRSAGIYATSNISKIDENTGFDAGPPVIEGSLNIIKKISGYKEVMCCTVLKSKNILAVGFSDGIVECYDSKKGLSRQCFRYSDGEDDVMPVNSISSIEDEFLLSSYGSGISKMWQRSLSRCVWTIEEKRQPIVNTVRPDNQVIAIGGDDSKITLYDVQSQKLVRTLQSSDDEDVMDGHTMRIFAVKYHPHHPNELISGGWDNSVLFWDDRQPNSARRIYGPHICGESIVFLDHGDTILTASYRKYDPLQLWSYDSGKLIKTVVPDHNKSFLYCCEYIPDHNMVLVGGGSNNLFRVVECGSWMTIACYKNLLGAVYCVGVLPPEKPRDLHFCFGSCHFCYMMKIDSS